MATTQKISDDHWVVHLQARDKSEVKVEVNMTREKAEQLAKHKGDLGSSILFILSGAAAG